jgi:uncharacterized protein (DUF1778 family)
MLGWKGEHDSTGRIALMSEKAATAPERINFRLPAASKELIEQAAAVTGQSLTDFAKTTLVRCAREMLEEHNRIVLSQRDGEAFMELLEVKSKPTPVMARAVKRYRKRYIDRRRSPR